MARLWSREHLVRRIDRCYLLAAATKIPEIREWYISRARHYRRMLSSAFVGVDASEKASFKPA